MSEHENSDVVVLLFFHVVKTLGVDEQHVYSLAIGTFDFDGLVPHPQALGAGVSCIAHSEAAWLSCEMVEDIRLAAAVLARNANNSDGSLDLVQELHSFRVDLEF